MNHEQEANRLIEEFYGSLEINLQTATKCAIKCVQEILKSDIHTDTIEDWDKVKTILENKL